MHAIQYWKSHLPKDLFLKSSVTFCVATLVTTTMTKNGEVGLASGALSALATLTHGVISPIFRAALHGKIQLTRGEELLRGSIALVGTGGIAKALGVANPWGGTFWAGVGLHGIGTLWPQLAHVSQNLEIASILMFFHPAFVECF